MSCWENDPPKTHSWIKILNHIKGNYEECKVCGQRR